MKSSNNKKNGINSLLSLRPLVTVIKKITQEDKPGARKLYEALLKDIDAVPDLLQPMEDVAILNDHASLVETLLSTLFPPSTVEHDGLYAVSFPFHFETIFSSPRFKDFFLKGENNEIVLPDRETNVQISKSSLSLAYNIILRKFYSVSVPAVASSVHPFPDPETGLITYMELNLNAQFVDVKLIDKNFTLPTNFSLQQSLDIDELKAAFPLENFQFEGIVVIDVLDVTSDQVIAEIKNTLLNINTISDTTVYTELENHIQTLIGLRDIEIGVSPFFIMNNVFLHSESHNANSLLFKHEKAAANQSKIIALCQQVFKNSEQPMLFQTLGENNSGNNELVKYYYELGAKSLIICPLKSEDGNLIGLLEIISKQAGTLKFQHLAKLQPAMPLFALALDRTNENIESQIDNVRFLS